MSVGVKITGKINTIFNSELIGQFEKRVIWLQEPDTMQYPQTYQIEFHQGDCNQLDRFKPGDVVECSIDLRGKLFTRKDGNQGVINTMKCWRIAMVDAVRSGPAAAPPAPQPPQNPLAGTDNFKDDLSF